MAKQRNNNANGPSFADAIENSLPDLAELDSIYAAAGGGSRKPPGVRTIGTSDPQNPYGLPFDYFDFDFHHDVFVIYRPWTGCRRCQESLAKKEPLPDEITDPICPHTRRREYVAQVQRFLTEGHLQRSSREETLMDGSIQVSLSWLVPRANQKKLAEAKKKSQVRTSEDPA